MHRPRLALGFLLAPIIFTLAFVTLGCGMSGQEKSTLDSFFRASKLRDNPTLGNIATVSFDRNTEGVVESFSLVNIGQEQVQPLHLKELAQEHAAAKKADEDFTTKKRAFQDEHADELKAYIDAEKSGAKPKVKISAAFQTAWVKWVEDTKTSAKRVSDAREKLSAERSIADVSVANNQNPVDPTEYEGELASKECTINANILTPSGQHVTKTLLVMLHQARLKADKPIIGKWVVTKIVDKTAGSTKP